MRPQIFFRLASPTLGLCLMALGGCASTPPAWFYVLSARIGGGTAPPVAAAERGLAIGIGPVTLPKYLDQPQIVTSISPYALNVAEFDRWAEPLESTFVRVLAEDLALLRPTARAETVHEVLVPDLDGLEPRLTRLGYPVKSLCEALNARPAEIRAFLRGRLAPGRMQELHQELLKLGVVA